MAWRGLHLTVPARLSLHRGSLRVVREEAPDLTVPLEDLGWIILDTQQATVTAGLLAACAAADVLVLISDERHLPVAAMIPRAGYHRQLATIRAQTGASVGLRNRIWRDLIRVKIAAQSAILTQCRGAVGPARGTAAALSAMAGRVKPGDPDNVEALAAQSYWPAMFPGLVRGNDADGRNAWLNYAYAVMRAALSRELAALGFELALGIHHQGELNPQNLADDLIEPFRPLCDRIVFRHLSDRTATASSEAPFDVAARRALAGLLSEQVGVEGGSASLLTAAGRAAAGLRAALLHASSKALILPSPIAAPGTQSLFEGMAGRGDSDHPGA